MLSLNLLKVLTTFLVVFILKGVYRKYRLKQLSIFDFVFWFSFWLLLLLVVYFPQKTDILADVLGVGRGVDVFVFFSITLLSYLIFRIYIKIEKLEHSITEIVRRIALDKEKLEKERE